MAMTDRIKTSHLAILCFSSVLIFLISSIIPIIGWLFAAIIIDGIWEYYSEELENTNKTSTEGT